MKAADKEELRRLLIEYGNEIRQIRHDAAENEDATVSDDELDDLTTSIRDVLQSIGRH